MHNFTIGQRRGVGVGTGGKAWVCRLDPETGDVHITNSEDRLLCDEIRVAGLSWVSPGLPEAPLERPIECEVQVRYRSAPVAATLVSVAGGECRVALHAPARAVAPGQAAVFYRGDAVLGRGWIVGTSVASAKKVGHGGFPGAAVLRTSG
jgi:tRNA-specific 2-thiouridylase